MNKRKLLSLLLVLAMVFTLLPAPAAYAEGDDGDTTIEETTPADENTETPAAPENPAEGDEDTDPAPTEGEGNAAENGDVNTGDTTAPAEQEQQPDEQQPDAPATLTGDAAVVEARDTSDDEFYKILHLDCGRKYFTKDWIIALINEMAAAGYNQLQLAFGNDGLRFLLDDMSFTANGTTYDHSTVVSKVEAGNKAQNSSNDSRWLNEDEMDAIIAHANEKGIEIVPLLNLPGHANAILDIADDAYNASGSNNTLDVATNDNAVNFGYALFIKYVDYFDAKGCKFFNFGADEYANDASGTFSFSRLNSEQYGKFVSFINKLASYIGEQGMTPRSFNDGLYYNNQTSVEIDTAIQCCYWSSGWSGYSVASASTISGKGHGMINTNGDYYYVLGKVDKFDSGYDYAKNFSNTSFMGSTISAPAGSMFCIWCDSPNAESETEVAKNTRLVLRAMAARMNGEDISTISTDVVPGGFNADGTINAESVADEVVVKNESGEALTALALSANSAATLTIGTTATWMSSDESVVTLASADESGIATLSTAITAEKVIATAVGAGEATISAATADGKTATLSVTVADTQDAATGTTVEVNLKVGETKNETQENVNNAGNVSKKDLDTYIATVSVTGTDATGGGTGYTYTQVSNVKCSSLISKDTSDYTATDYFYKTDDGTYYPLYVTRSTEWRVYYYYYYYDGSSYQQIGTQNVNMWNAGGTNVDITLYTRTETTTDPVAASTTVTFTGVGESTTTVTVGDTTYNIHVTAPTTIESKTMILNSTLALPTGAAEVEITGTAVTNNSGTLTAAAEGSATVTFVTKNAGGYVTAHYTYNITVIKEDLTNVTPLNLEHWITNKHVYPAENANSGSETSISAEAAYGENGIEVSDSVFDPGYSQSSGDEVAYWKAVRLPSSDKQTTASGADKSSAGTTLTHVRYYESKWSYKKADGSWADFASGDQLVAYYVQKQNVTKEITSYFKDWGHAYGTTPSGGQYGYVGLTVAVVYPDGTLSPAEANMKSSSTTIFNFWTDRNIGVIVPKNNSDYSISKITVTDGTGDCTKWDGSFTWEKKTLEDGETQWYDETTVWDKSYDTDPIVDATDSTNNNLIWSEKNTAKLILIYLEVEEKETNLNVVWYDRTANAQIASMQVAMAYTTGQDEPTYTTALKDASGTVIGATKNWSGTTTSASNYLPDDAYVTNASNVNQTFNKNLVTNPTVPSGVYKSGIYAYNGAKISEDGKTLTLYYVLDSGKLSKSYVVDFGLTVKIPMSDLVENVGNVSSVSIQTPSNGTASYDATGKQIVYKPDETLDNTVTLVCTVSFGSSTETFRVGILPASNVLYEENFFTTTSTDWTKTAHSLDNQTASVANDENDLYGYDVAYATATGSQGVYKAENLWNGDEVKSTGALTTTFYGNGFDLIGTTATNTGAVLLKLTKLNADGSSAGGYLKYVDTRRVSSETTALYQVPLAHVELGNEDATWEVTVIAAGLKATDNYSKGIYVEIDSFRVYRTSDNTAYPASEQNVTYTNILDAVGNTIIAWREDANGSYEISTSEYEKSGGPQNEIYLMKDQAVSFKLTGASSVDVSVRAVGGASGTYTSNTEMYYNFTAVDGVVTITNTNNTMIAIGNVKLPKGASVEGYNSANEAALFASVRMAFAAAYAPAYEPIHNIDVKSVNVLRNKLVTLTVTTDTDVKTLTVNGKTLRPTNALAVKRGWSSEYVYVYADTVRRNETKDYTVTVTNADGQTASQTVQG